MKKQIENLDDVVFEERNKDYGAYFLRRSYNKNVTRALFLATLIFLGIVSIPLIAGLMNKTKKISIEGDAVVFENLDKPKTDDQKIELPKPQPLLERVPAFKIRVVDSTEIADAEDLIDIIDSAGIARPPDIDDGTLIVDDTKKPLIIDPQKEEVFIDVQEMPDFIGGLEKLYEYLGINIKYPQIAIDNRITGKVHVKFVVEKDGSISNAELLNDIGAGCGEEALRVVRSMPKWKAGKQNGTYVRVQYIIPINFILED